MKSFALITSLILLASSLHGATGLEDGAKVAIPATGPHTPAASFAGVAFTASNNVFTGATQTMPKLVALEVQGTNVVEAGVAGTTAGLLSIADRNAGRGWNNLAVSNGVLYLNDVLEGSSNFVNQAGDTMTGNLAMGGNDVTGADSVSTVFMNMTNALGTNTVFQMVLIGATNYFSLHVTGSSVSNLFPVLIPGQ